MASRAKLTLVPKQDVSRTPRAEKNLLKERVTASEPPSFVKKVASPKGLAKGALLIGLTVISVVVFKRKLF